jgi:hypothetical protein
MQNRRQYYEVRLWGKKLECSNKMPLSFKNSLLFNLSTFAGGRLLEIDDYLHSCSNSLSFFGHDDYQASSTSRARDITPDLEVACMNTNARSCTPIHTPARQFMLVHAPSRQCTPKILLACHACTLLHARGTPKV